MQVRIGSQFKFQHQHLFQYVTWVATVTSVNDGIVTFRLPEKSTRVPFPPLWVGDKPTRFGKIPASKIPEKAFIR